MYSHSTVQELHSSPWRFTGCKWITFSKQLPDICCAAVPPAPAGALPLITCIAAWFSSLYRALLSTCHYCRACVACLTCCAGALCCATAIAACLACLAAPLCCAADLAAVELASLVAFLLTATTALAAAFWPVAMQLSVLQWSKLQLCCLFRSSSNCA